MHEHELQFHIKCKAGDVARYCFLPGDPGRCEDEPSSSPRSCRTQPR